MDDVIINTINILLETYYKNHTINQISIDYDTYNNYQITIASSTPITVIRKIYLLFFGFM